MNLNLNNLPPVAMASPQVTIGSLTYRTPYNETYDCDIILSHYPNGQHCLELVDSTYNEPVACASQPLDLTGAISNKFLNATLANHCVAIKDHSENAGILKQLISADIVLPPTIHVGGTFSGVYICELVCKLQRELPL